MHSGTRALVGIVLVVGVVVPHQSSAAGLPNEQKAIPADGAAFDHFGDSVAISGGTAVVGAPFDDSGKGAAYIYTRSGPTWAEEAKLTASDGTAGDFFGWSVAISGGTAVVGARLDDDEKGSAYVYRSTAGIWSEEQKLTAPDRRAVDNFGYAVAVSGRTAVVGAPFANDGRGSAYFYTRGAADWTEEQELPMPNGEAGDNFGFSVQVSANSAVVGAPGDDYSRGSAFVYTRSGEAWTVEQKLTASDGQAVDNFGYSVDLSAGTALVGAPFHDDAAGSAYLYTRAAGIWSERQELTASDRAAGDLFGWSTAVWEATSLVGAPADQDGKGSAYEYTLAGPTWTEEQKLTAPDGAPLDNFADSLDLAGGAAVIGAPFDDNHNGIDAGSVYFYSRI